MSYDQQFSPHDPLVFLTVQLDVIDLPLCEGVGVDLEVAEDAGVAGAREVAVVLVDAELEAVAVNLKRRYL